VILGFAAMTLSYGAAADAAVLFQDNFDSYNPGQLATTDASSANTQASNPWWAPNSGNGVITGATGGVTPHSGTQMLAGAGTNDFDQNVVNIAYRYGNQAPIKGNLSLDFYFYDAKGAGDTATTGYGELGYYSGVPSNADYNSSHSLSFDGATIQRVILGTANNSGSNANVYQARVIGGTATIGSQYSTTYINTTAARSVGWHEGRIVVGPQLTTGGNLIDFYIDNMNTPVAEATTTLANGYNTLILDAQESSSPATSTINYFDDVTLTDTTPTPEPASVSLLALAGCAVLGRRRRKA
jgi:hypothetical protein